MLETVTPIALATYLKHSGWSFVEKWGAHAALFNKEVDGTNAELTIPDTKSIRDFDRRIQETLVELSRIEARPPEYVFRDITTVSFDRIRFRSKASSKTGNIPLGEAETLFGSARDLLVNICNFTAIGARPQFRGRRPKETSDYLEEAQLGQTEYGSFVLSILSPHYFNPPDSEDFFKAPFGRRVTENLAKALVATERALSASVSIGPKAFLQAVDSGVSANFCRALSHMAEVDEGIEIGINWSPQKPTEVQLPKITISKDAVSILNDAASMLAETPVQEHVELLGTVLGISENKRDFKGEITLHAEVNGRPRAVKLNFEDTDRDKVFDAFKQKADQLMSVEGYLTSDGSRLRLDNPRNFKAIPID